jgi:protein-disulfide isomerase
MEQKRKVNYLIILLLVVMFITTVLLFFRFMVGREILINSQKTIAKIQKNLEQPEVKLVTPIHQADSPSKGLTTAPHLIYVFSSFSCIYCQQQAAILNQLTAKYPREALIIWKDAASPLDIAAQSAAIAARCAQKQNNFWQFHDYLFANQQNLNLAFYQSVAQKLNLNLADFLDCLQNEATLPLVESDMAEAIALDIDTTPYLFIDNKRISGVITLEELEKELNLKE